MRERRKLQWSFRGDEKDLLGFLTKRLRDLYGTCNVRIPACRQAGLLLPLSFYTQYYGDSAVFLSDKGYHHHIGLNTWAGKDIPPAPPGHSGLYHLAILFETRQELAAVLKKLIDENYPISGAADHGVSEAIYLNDPDGIGVELYVDRPKSQWNIDDQGMIEMVTEPLDIESLLSEL